MITAEVVLSIAPLNVTYIFDEREVGRCVSRSGRAEARGESRVCNKHEAKIVCVLPQVTARSGAMFIAPGRVREVEISADNEGAAACGV